MGAFGVAGFGVAGFDVAGFEVLEGEAGAARVVFFAAEVVKAAAAVEEPGLPALAASSITLQPLKTLDNAIAAALFKLFFVKISTQIEL